MLFCRHRRRHFLTTTAAGLSLPIEKTFIAITAAAMHKLHAVALAEQPAAFVPIQRQLGSHPPA